jgi:UDP-N-acetylmuramoyl-L-alanyl-D-glutamate--2,6-diaminopimelate ligase
MHATAATQQLQPTDPAASRFGCAAARPPGRFEGPFESRKSAADQPRRRAKWLSELASAIGASCTADALITGIASDSRRVRPGDLFVAATGDKSHLGDFIADARRRGAAGIVAPEAVAGAACVAVSDPRAALPQLAAAFHDYPADELQLIGITGTLGKTSTMLLLADILEADRKAVGVVGSLGIKLAEATRETGITTPDASVLQEALRWFADQGVGHVAMEVTSHALSQRRVDGLHFCLGLLTNLVPDEHLEYHPTPEDYLQTKMRFLEFLDPAAPLVINADCELTRERTGHLGQPGGRGVVPGRAERGRAGRRHRGEGRRVAVHAARRPPGAGLDSLAPGREMPLRLPLVGVTQVANAAMAAIAALLLGASPEAIRRGLANAHPIRRRMEVIGRRPARHRRHGGQSAQRRGRVRDHPAPAPKGRLRILFGIRGMRGPEINARLATALAKGIGTNEADLVVTSSDDVADGRNRVQPAERDAFIDSFRASAGGTALNFQPALGDAVPAMLDGVGEDDVVLLLGAQGLDAAAAMVLDYLK